MTPYEALDFIGWSARKMAQKIDRPIDTVQSWLRRDNMPVRYRKVLERLVKSHSIPISFRPGDKIVYLGDQKIKTLTHGAVYTVQPGLRIIDDHGCSRSVAGKYGDDFDFVSEGSGQDSANQKGEVSI